MATKGKIVLMGNIKTLSPLHIGCGSEDRSDIDVLRSGDGTPLIPATSLIGVLKSIIESSPDYHQFPDDNNKKKKCFWGRLTTDEDGHQSTFRCADLECLEPPKFLIRDGIKIDGKTGLVADQKKYDYEVIERGAVFNLRLEFDYTDEDQAFVKKMIATMVSLLKNEHVQIGAKTNSGLGAIRLEDEFLYEFIFSEATKAHVYYWLTQQFTDKNEIKSESLGTPFDTNSKCFRIEATFFLKSSLIIRSYPDDPKSPDAVHLRSLGEPVLTATSIKGAIRARAERIVNTIKKSDSIVHNLFGIVEEKGISDRNDPDDKKKVQKGKIQVKECILPMFSSEIQTRIKIDRFTGGTIDSALFDTMPLFSNSNGDAITISIRIHHWEEAEAGLMLLVLKDLWTGDLAIGGEKNIGRGVLEGISATIRYDNATPISIGKDLNRLSLDDKNMLQHWVDALWNHSPG